jgi:MFS family permease
MQIAPPPAGAQAASRRARSLSAFNHPDYRYLLIGTMGSQMGDWIQTVGQGWLILLLTHSAAQLGIFGFVRGAAILVVTPFGGVIADRLNRRNLLVTSTAVGAVTACILAVLVATGLIRVWELYLTGICDGLVASISQPVRQVMVYDVVGSEDLTNAVAHNAIGGNLTRIVGPAAGGLLLGLGGVASCFFGQAACYLVASGATFLIRTEGRAEVARSSVLSSLREGARYIAQQPLIQLLLLTAIIPSLLVYPYLRFMPVFATDVLHSGALGYGFLLTGVGFGSILGAAGVAWITEFRYKGLAMLVGNTIYMAMIGAFALAHIFVLAFAFLVLAGIANTVYNTYNQTLLQWNIEDAYRGRVLALYLTGSNLTPIGSLAMGFMIVAWSPSAVVASFCAIAVLALLAVTALSPSLRRL